MTATLNVLLVTTASQISDLVFMLASDPHQCSSEKT